jgi:large subunit ribosomal protein L30e
MVTQEEIRSAVSKGDVIIGYRESIKYLKSNVPKLVVIANNIPERMRKDLEDVSRVSGAKIEVFEKDSVTLGVICGKPFPVSVLVIK